MFYMTEATTDHTRSQVCHTESNVQFRVTVQCATKLKLQKKVDFAYQQMDAKVLRPLGGLIISIRCAQLNLETYVKRFSLFSTFSLSLFFIKEILMTLEACLVDIQNLLCQKFGKLKVGQKHCHRFSKPNIRV